MKKLSYLIIVLLSGVSFAQDIDEQDDSFISERNKTVLSFDIKQPFTQVKPASCNQFEPVGLQLGNIDTYKDILTKYMYSYLNSEYYTLSGDFTFTLSIDKEGKLKDIVGLPAVRNSEVFFEDMKYIFRRIKETWKPATCNGVPVDSQLKIKMSFTSTNIEA